MHPPSVGLPKPITLNSWNKRSHIWQTWGNTLCFSTAQPGQSAGRRGAQGKAELLRADALREFWKRRRKEVRHAWKALLQRACPASDISEASDRPTSALCQSCLFLFLFFWAEDFMPSSPDGRGSSAPVALPRPLPTAAYSSLAESSVRPNR